MLPPMSPLLGGLVVLVAIGAAVVLLAPPVARRFGIGVGPVAAALVAIGLVVGLTLAIRLVETASTRVGVGWPRMPCVDAGDCTDRVVELDTMWWLNVVMFVPAGFFVLGVARRVARVMAGLVVFSLGIEITQGVTGLGAPDPGDLVANSLGAAVGVAAGAVVLRARQEPTPDRERGTTARAVVLWVVGSIAAVAFVWTVVVGGAGARRAALADDVRTAFAGTTAADIAAELATPAGAERLFAATATRPGYLGEVGSTGVYEARYSTQFFGVDRCVFARWDDRGVTLTDGDGVECTEFRDRPPAE